MPRTLQPLLEKRMALKQRLLALPPGTRAAKATRKRARLTNGCW